MKKIKLFTIQLVLFAAIGSRAEGNGISVQKIIKESGVTGGFVVHVGDGNGEVLADLHANESYLVQGLCPSAESVSIARDYLREKGLYGKVSVRHWNKNYLPYADNMVNLLIADDLGNIPMEEVNRVLAPNGVVSSFKSQVSSFKKPWPKEIDEWTHFLHGPDNNAVAEDTVVGVPKHVQWIGAPKYARSHEQLASVSSMVSAKGKLFYIIDEGQTADIRLPARWKLIARDAFNGVVLWTRSIDNWSDHMHSFRSGPPDLPFRLVAVGDRVYVSLDQSKPIHALDAATGETVLTYEGTDNARQIMYARDRLVMLTGTSQVEVYRKPKGSSAAKRWITTANPETGAVIWKKEIDTEAFLPLVAADGSLLYQTLEKLVCLDLETGKEKWKTAHPLTLVNPNSKEWNWATPTLVAKNGIVYVSDFKSLSAISVKDGEELWNSSSRPGFSSSPDTFLINGLLWRGYTDKRGSADFG